MPIDSVQTLLEHASPRTTQVYSRLALATVRRDYDAAMSVIAGPAPGAVAIAPSDGRARIGA